MKLRHVVIIVIFILINAGVLMTLNFGKKGAEEEEKSTETFVQSLQATKIMNTKEVFNVSGYGTISSFNRVDVSSEVQGKLIKGRRNLKPGVNFKKGDLLFRVNDTEARYNIRARKSGFINIIANMLPDIKVDFPAEFDKWSNYITSIKLNESLPQLPSWKTSKEKIFLSTRNVLTEFFSIKALEEQLRKFAFYAPFNGVITDVFVADYAVVNPGGRVMTIVQTGNFEIAVSVPAGQLETIEVGSECSIYTTSGDLKGSGKVVRISEVINKSTQSIDVYVKPIALEGEEFIEGEYVKVDINESGEYRGARVPLSSLMDNQVYVYSKNDSTISMRQITVLDQNDQGVFVSGLPDKSVVITQEVLTYSDTTKYGVLIK